MDNAPSLYLLLTTYWQTYEDLSQAMRRTDATTNGTPSYAVALAAQLEACDRLTKAEVDIAGFVPVHRFEAKIKTNFIIQLASGNGDRLEEDVLTALLSSLSDLVKWSENDWRVSA